MFGHDNNDQDQNTSDQTADNAAVVAPDTTADDTSSDDDTAPVIEHSQPDEQTGAPAVSDDISSTPPAADDDLLDIKKQALQQLSPLVDHLDQTPEEKFKTTMMMIQAADNKSLVQTAYEAAQQISDEKTRAQALLDVINEINYFTHNEGKED